MDLNNKKNLFIADRCYFPLIFKFKNEHPELDIKLIDKSELILKLSFCYKGDVLKDVINGDTPVEYSKAKQYLYYLPLIDSSKNIKTSYVFNLVKDKLIYDYLGLKELSDKQIYLFECQEDQDIKSLLTRNNLSYQDITFDDLCIKPINSFNTLVAYKFEDKLSQYFYIFADIRKRLLDDESIKNKIKILINDDADAFYISLCSKLFNIPTYTNEKKTLLVYPGVKEKVNSIYFSKSFEFTDEELSHEYLKLLHGIITAYDIDKSSLKHGFDFAYSNLLEALDANKVSEACEEKGITVTKSFNIDPNALMYVTNFQFNAFYKEDTDNQVLGDAELKELGVCTSYQRTALDRRQKLNYLKHANILLLSRVKQHLSDSIYDSQFIEEFDLESTNMKVKGKGVYTKAARELYVTTQLDKEFFTAPYQKINTYDHSYKKVNTGDKFKKKVWSLTNLESYINCPFKYYLTAILPSKDEDYHARYRGTLIHRVFEDIYHPGFDFETSFKNGKQAYIDQCEQNKETFGPKEEAWVSLIHNWLSKYIHVLQKVNNVQTNVVQSPKDFEIPVSFYLTDAEGNKYPFAGQIDKVVWTKFNGHLFYTIIDYKSGNEYFEPKEVFLGKSIQLPLYYYALSAFDENKQYTGDGDFGGFGIEHVFFSTIKKAMNKDGVLNESKLLQNMHIAGLYNDSTDYWHSFDETAIKEDGSLNEKGGLIAGRTSHFSKVDAEESINKQIELNKYNVNDLVNEAKDAAIKTINHIKNADFDIKPTGTSLTQFQLDRLQCSYCVYRDICYVKKSKDSHDYRSDIAIHFDEKKKEEESEEVING